MHSHTEVIFYKCKIELDYSNKEITNTYITHNDVTNA